MTILKSIHLRNQFNLQRNFNDMLIKTHQTFKRFIVLEKHSDALILSFDSKSARDLFHQECLYDLKVRSVMKVKLLGDDQLQLDSRLSVFDVLFCDHGLLNLSQSLELCFTVELEQSYSNTSFMAELLEGELGYHRLLVSVSLELPELSLGQLTRFIESEEEFDLLGGRIQLHKSRKIL